MTRPLSLVAKSRHNKGRFQFNLHFQGFGFNEFPFIDAVKLAQPWTYTSNGVFAANGWVSPEFMDANGYPTQIQAGGYRNVTGIPPTLGSATNTAKTGQYVLRWKGTGTLWVSGQPDQAGTNGRYLFTPAPNTSPQVLDFGVRSMDSVDYITSISIYALSDEEAYLAGEVWNPDFIARFNDARPGVLRFMNWLSNNTASLTTWSTRKPVTYFSQATGLAKQAWFKGTASLSGHDYTLATGDALSSKLIYQIQYGGANVYTAGSVTFAGDTINWPAHPLSNGDMVALIAPNGGAASNLRWSGENLYVVNATADAFQVSLTPGGAVASLGTANSGGVSVQRLPTLSIDGGTTKRPIRNEYGDPLGTNLRGVDSGGRALWATVIYDDVLECWLNRGVTNDIASFFSAGTSPELMLDLAIKIKTHPWFNFPFLALDPMTDYTQELVTYIKNNAPFWMVPKFEGPNEHWNFAGGFHATRYGWNIAFKRWGIFFGTSEWQAKITSTIAQKIYEIYGSPALNGDKYWMINGFQTASLSSVAGAPIERLRGSTYVNQAAAAQSGYAKIAPHYLCTHIAVANYFNSSEYRTGTTYTGAIVSNVLTTTARLGDSSDNPKVGDKLYYGSVNGTVTILSIDSFNSNTRLGTYTVSSTPDAASQTIIGGADNTEAVRAYKYAQGDTSQLATYLLGTTGAADGDFNFAQNIIYWQNAKTIGRTYRNKDGFAQRITAYEGGYSPDETGTTQVNAFRAATKSHVDCGKLVCGGILTDETVVNGNFNDFVDAGGEYPSQYLLGGRNVWAALDPSIYVAPDPPIWGALKTFNGL